MEIEKIKNVVFRRKLERKNFYEDITFKSKEFKKFISEWIYNIQKYRNIKIERFKDLFTDVDEIVFPINVKKCCESHIVFVDCQGEEYYVLIYDWRSYDCTKYIVGRRNSSIEPLLDRDFHYEIFQDGNGVKKVLKETGVLQLTKQGTNKDIGIDFCYDMKKNLTVLKLSTVRGFDNIVIEYPIQNRKFDDNFMKYLFEKIERNWWYYNVIPLLKKIIDLIPDEKISVSIIATVNREVSSEIIIVNGIVQKYTFTEIVSEDEIHIHKRIFAKEIEEFLKNN